MCILNNPKVRWPWCRSCSLARRPPWCAAPPPPPTRPPSPSSVPPIKNLPFCFLRGQSKNSWFSMVVDRHCIVLDLPFRHSLFAVVISLHCCTLQYNHTFSLHWHQSSHIFLCSWSLKSDKIVVKNLMWSNLLPTMLGQNLYQKMRKLQQRLFCWQGTLIT